MRFSFVAEEDVLSLAQLFSLMPTLKLSFSCVRHGRCFLFLFYSTNFVPQIKAESAWETGWSKVFLFFSFFQVFTRHLSWFLGWCGGICFSRNYSQGLSLSTDTADTAQLETWRKLTSEKRGRLNRTEAIEYEHLLNSNAHNCVCPIEQLIHGPQQHWFMIMLIVSFTINPLRMWSRKKIKKVARRQSFLWWQVKVDRVVQHTHTSIANVVRPPNQCFGYMSDFLFATE